MSKYEYGIMNTRTGEITHEHLDEEMANAVMRDLKEDGAKAGAWMIVRRLVSYWENATNFRSLGRHYDLSTTVLADTPEYTSTSAMNLNMSLLGDIQRPYNLVITHEPSETGEGIDLHVSWIEYLGNAYADHVKRLMHEGTLDDVMRSNDEIDTTLPYVREEIGDKIEERVAKETETIVYRDHFGESAIYAGDATFNLVAEYNNVDSDLTMEGVRKMIKPFLETMSEITNVDSKNYIFGEFIK